jgi:hypothetical protein
MIELVLKEQKRLKASGWKPKFRGDTSEFSSTNDR